VLEHARVLLHGHRVHRDLHRCGPVRRRVERGVDSTPADWRARLPGETMPASRPAIGDASESLVMNLFWAPAQLAVLAKVVDLNGFSAAARTLGVPKAAVSRAVADLEKALGVRVLERTTRRISLTPAGRLVYPHAKRVVEEFDAAHVLIAKLHAPTSGPLRVVADPTYGRVLLSPLVPRFLERFPEVPLDVALLAVEGSQQWDVAIRAGLPDDSSVEHRLLGALPAVLCATPQYLQQRGTPAKPDDLREHDLFTPESDRPDLYRVELSRNS